MGREEEIIKEREKKISELRKKGINPYANRFDKKDSVSKALKAKLGAKIKTAGRIMTKREIGKIIFSNLQDFSGKIQIVLQGKETPAKDFDFFKRYIDIGDIIGIEGKTIKTKTGEKSVLVKKLTLLTKSLLPLPSKWYGLQDKEERYRKRYLDLIMNPEVKKVFEKKAKVIKALRNFLLKKDFIEVTTPTLQPIPGGALAKPFKTYYNIYKEDVYLRIAPELYLKKLIIGGFEKVFEFADCFRNEGADWSHNPEFTILEFYQAYIDYEDLMRFTEDLIIDAIKKVNGKAEIKKGKETIRIKKPFKRITFEKLTKGKMSNEIFKEEIRKLKEPTFVINHPFEISPLAKKKDKKTVQRFQLVIGGLELVNAYSELNDPFDQKKRFNEQAKKKEGEKHEYDKDFVKALEYGMPPTGGWGFGVDRFAMLLTDSPSIRDVTLFPFMKLEK